MYLLNLYYIIQESLGKLMFCLIVIIIYLHFNESEYERNKILNSMQNLEVEDTLGDLEQKERKR